MTPEQKEKLFELLSSFIKGRWFLILAILLFGAMSNYFEFLPSPSAFEYFFYLAFFVFLYNILNIIVFKIDWLKDRFLASLAKLSIFSDVLSVTLLVLITSKSLSPFFVFYIVPIIEAALIFRVFGFILSLGAILFFYNFVVLSGNFAIIQVLINNLIILLFAFFAEFILLHISAQEQKLIFERDKIRTLLKNLTAGLILIDNKGKISFSNPQAEKFLEFKQNEVLGLDINSKDIERFPYLKEITKLSKKFDFNKESSFNIQLKNILNSYLRVTPVFIQDEHSHYLGIMYVLEDLSREKLLSDMKSEFISLAAHQLRTPLSAIKWLLRMLLTGDLGQLSDEQKEYIKKGYDTNERLIELVRDLLNVSRIEEGKFGFNFKKGSIKEVLEKIAPMYVFKAQEKDIHFVFNEATEPIPEVMLDEERISIVLQNLLDNAFKYTPKSGNVTLSLIPKENEVEIVVADDGIGIPEEDKKKIFSKFFRGYNVLKSGIEGTGLGLFIVKNIVEKHGGKIWFESEVNKGTTFHFTIPYPKNVS